MDYFVKGHLNMGEQAEIPAWLDQSRHIKKINIIRGLAFSPDSGEPANLYALEAWFPTAESCLSFYNKVTDLMEQHNIKGKIGWHECTHEDNDSPCVFNQIFEWGEA